MGELISIIIPVYNIEKEIGRCLERVIKQTYENIEIIVVDDGSIDKSGEIIDQYASKYPNVIKAYHKINGGVTSARLLGVEKATGEWIGFVDGDDVIEEDMYEFLISNAHKYNAQISHCGYQMVFDDGRVNYFYNTGCLVKQDRKAGIVDLLDGSRIEPGLWNKLYSKSLFRNLLHTDCIPRDIKINEDLLMNYYLFSESNLSVFEDKCKYHYMIRGTSVSRQKANVHKIFDPIKVKQIILEQCDEEIVEYARKAFMNTCTYTYCGLALENKAEYRKEKQIVRQYLVDNKKWSSLLPKRTRLLAEMIIKSPGIFQILYPIYTNNLQKKKYD